MQEIKIGFETLKDLTIGEILKIQKGVRNDGEKNRRSVETQGQENK